jgi:hypothetical protein
MGIDMTIKAIAVNIVGQMKRVWVKGITPLMAYSCGGIELFVAIIMAADEERPSAQTAPNPR